MALCGELPFVAVARVVGLCWHRVAAICERYVDLALDRATSRRQQEPIKEH